MKKRLVLLVALLLAMSMTLVACDDMVNSGLIKKLIEQIWGDPDNIPEDITLPDDLTWFPTSEPNTDEPTTGDPNTDVLPTSEPNTDEPPTSGPNTDESPTSEPIPDEPYPTPSEGLAFSSNGDGTCSVTGIGTCTDSAVVIPSKSPDGDVVIGISAKAFESCNTLISVMIPNSVTSIGDAAFSNCLNLESVSLSRSVARIGREVFRPCHSLKSITVSDQNETFVSIDNCVIEKGSGTLVIGCNSSVIPDGVTKIADWAFSGSLYLTNIVIPESVTSIGYGAFESTGLTELVIPNGVTSIGHYAFFNCHSLTGIVIAESVIDLGLNALGNNGVLESIVVDENNERYMSINNCLIERKSSTILFGCKSSIIPSNVKIIGSGAFSGMNTWTSIVIPDSVISIEDAAFSACNNIKTIVIPSSVTNIGRSAFNGCFYLDAVYYTGTEQEWNAINIGGDNEPFLAATIHFDYVPEE